MIIGWIGLLWSDQMFNGRACHKLGAHHTFMKPLNVYVGLNFFLETKVWKESNLFVI